jgi:multicomponent K+:H+ antiporter subunit D
MTWANHLLVAPILLPLVTGAFLLLFDERRHSFKALISLFSTLTLLTSPSADDLCRRCAGIRRAATQVYLLGNWPPRSASCWYSTACRR